MLKKKVFRCVQHVCYSEAVEIDILLSSCGKIRANICWRSCSRLCRCENYLLNDYLEIQI